MQCARVGPVKIALVTDCYLPRLGGIEVQVRDLAHGLRAAGHDVEVFTATVGEDGQHGGLIEVVDGIPVHRLGMDLPIGFPLNPFASRELRRRLGRGFDVAHVHIVPLDLNSELVLFEHIAVRQKLRKDHAVVEQSIDIKPAGGQPHTLVETDIRRYLLNPEFVLGMNIEDLPVEEPHRLTVFCHQDEVEPRCNIIEAGPEPPTY